MLLFIKLMLQNFMLMTPNEDLINASKIRLLTRKS